MRKKVIVLVSLLFVLVDMYAQTFYYDTTQVFYAQRYVCDVTQESKSVRLYSKSNKFTEVEAVNKETGAEITDAVFIAQAYGIPLTPAAIATVIATATIASIGTAGVPSVGLVTLSMVLTSVGLPTEGIALIMGIDRILDMLRTAVNITGDAVCTTIVAKQQSAFNEKTFQADN